MNHAYFIGLILILAIAAKLYDKYYLNKKNKKYTRTTKNIIYPSTLGAMKKNGFDANEFLRWYKSKDKSIDTSRSLDFYIINPQLSINPYKKTRCGEHPVLNTQTLLHELKQ